MNHLLKNYLVAVVAAMCTIQYGYDAGQFSSIQVLPAWKSYFNSPGPAVIGACTSGFNAAAVVFGYFFSAQISDFYGRRTTMWCGSVFVIIGALIQSFVPSIGGFIAGRTVVGAGQGLVLPAGPVYIEELVYARIRGRMMSFWQMMFGVGQLFSGFIALGCYSSPGLGIWQWRIVTLIQIFPPIFLIGCLFVCPETPRWFLQKNRVSEARKVLESVRLPEEVEPELNEIQLAITFEKENTSGRYKQLFINQSYRKRFILALILNFGQQFMGINSLTSYGGTIFNEVFHSTFTSILLNGITSSLLLLYCLTATFLSDKWGRRPMLITGAIGEALTMMGVATLVTQAPKDANGQTKYSVGIGVAAFIQIFHVFYNPSWGATIWVFTAECFPMVVRANAVAIASQTQQLAGIIVGQAFPSFLARCGFYTFYFFMGINILLAIFVYIFLPETKGVKLEHMDAVFGGVDHVVGGEEKGYEIGTEVRQTDGTIVSS